MRTVNRMTVKDLLFCVLCLFALRVPLSKGQSEEEEQDVRVRRSFAQFSSMVTVGGFENEDLACGGVLIAEHVILTAAQCVVDESNSLGPVGVVLDVLNAQRINRPPETRQTVEGIVHPRYTGEIRDGYDLALLRLDRATRPLSTVDIRKEKVQDGTKLVTIGAAGKAIRIRRSVVVDGEECGDAFFDPDLMICLAGEVPCEGDEGGPILDEETGSLVGVVSMVSAACSSGVGHLGVRTLQTAEIIGWIETGIDDLEYAAFLDNTPLVTAFDGPDSVEAPPAPEHGSEDDLDVIEALGSIDFFA